MFNTHLHKQLWLKRLGVGDWTESVSPLFCCFYTFYTFSIGSCYWKLTLYFTNIILNLQEEDIGLIYVIKSRSVSPFSEILYAPQRFDLPWEPSHTMSSPCYPAWMAAENGKMGKWMKYKSGKNLGNSQPIWPQLRPQCIMRPQQLAFTVCDSQRKPPELTANAIARF